MIIEISVLIISLSFLALVVYVIRTLYLINKKLDDNIKFFTPALRSIHYIGEVLEKKSLYYKIKSFSEQSEPKEDTSEEVLKLILLSSSLWQKFKQRR